MRKLCRWCNEIKPLDDFYRQRGTAMAKCKVCHLAAIAASRRDKATDPAKREALLEQRKRWKQNRRHVLESRGLTTKGRKRKQAASLSADGVSRRAERDARITWQIFIRYLASDAWVMTYFAATKKPWLNPRLDERARWQSRFDNDPNFAQFWRAQDAARAKRKQQRTSAQSDGSITLIVWRRLLSAAMLCPYCDRQLTPSNKSLDHKMPVERGGAHSIDNVHIVCALCNSRKGTKTHEEFLDELGKSNSIKFDGR